MTYHANKGRTLVRLIVLVPLLLASAVSGQDLLDDVKVDASRPRVIPATPLMVRSDTFDRLVFGATYSNGAVPVAAASSAAGNPLTPTNLRATFRAQLKARLRQLEASCHPTPDQRGKLELAGTGDIDRLFNDLEPLREKFKQSNVNELNELVIAVKPYQKRIRTGIFGPDSMFAKVLRSSLTSEQNSLLKQSDRERREFKYESNVYWVVSKIEEAVPMKDEQRQQLIKLMLKETRPPNMFGTADYYYVLLHTSSIDHKKFAAILDAQQLERFQQILRDSQAAAQSMCQRDGIEPASDE